VDPVGQQEQERGAQQEPGVVHDGEQAQATPASVGPAVEDPALDEGEVPQGRYLRGEDRRQEVVDPDLLGEDPQRDLVDDQAGGADQREPEEAADAAA
jgi:hypothetical protein